MTSYPKAQVTGIVLAGGRGRRMGGEDKGLTLIAGQPMAAHVVAALGKQCTRVLINANRNHATYARFGCEVVADGDEEFNGPLAGIARGLESSETAWTLFAPCDSPLTSAELGPLLWAKLSASNADIAMAAVGERTHPVFALIRTNLVDSVKAALADGERKIDRWYAQHATITVLLPQIADSFLNVNRPEELAALEQRLSGSAHPEDSH